MNRAPLVIAGQFPPPVNGFAYITQEMVKTLATSRETTIIDLAPHFPKNGAPYHLRRLILTLKGYWPLLQSSFNKKRLFYVACEGGLGLIYSIMLCAMARVLGFSLFIHHHSFAYIEASSALMNLLLRILGNRATHIFLCPVMAQRYADRYQRPVKNLVLSNSAFVEEVFSAPRTWREGQPLVIGLLSNLNDEKGLGDFLNVLRSAASEGLNIRGVLAGPPVSDSDRDNIAAAERELGDRLDYRGPVYNVAKASFFQSIDMFVYPTKNDAQPMVIFEAMAHGVPVLSYARGCIRGQVGECGAVLERDGDFIPFALDWFKKHMTSPRVLEELKLATKVAFFDDRAQSKQRVKKLFDLEPLIIRPSSH